MSVLADYLTDPRDRAIIGATPTLCQPVFGELPPVPLGQSRYVMAENGLFVQARTHNLSVCAQIADLGQRMPYGRCDPFVLLRGGPVSGELAKQVVQRARTLCPTEWAGVVVYEQDDGYRLVEPGVMSASSGHIRYARKDYDEDALVLDIHSHGKGRAFFSDKDDESDLHGIYLACVLGCCGENQDIEVKTRIVIHGLFIEVPWAPWDGGE